MKEFKIIPQDILFFRDAKPMAAGEGYGNGCNMPYPNIVFSSIRTALMRQNGKMPEKKASSIHSKHKEKGRSYGLDKFGSLQIKKFLPFKDKYGVLFPIPRDVLKTDFKGLKKTELICFDDNNVIPVSTIPSSKEKVSGYWTEDQFMAYLKSDKSDFTPLKISELWQEEWRTGIEVDSRRFSTVEGKLYAGAYMRMVDDACYAVELECEEESMLDGSELLSFGGERKLVRLELSSNLFPEFTEPEIGDSDSGYIVKWILLTPALFANGSIPGWIEKKKVLLKPKIGNARIDIQAEFLSCSTGDPKPISGWDILENHAKPSLLAVQPGAVYYFSCAGKEDAKNLLNALHGKNRSDMLAEQGFGFGVCSIGKNNISKI